MAKGRLNMFKAVLYDTNVSLLPHAQMVANKYNSTCLLHGIYTGKVSRWFRAMGRAFLLIRGGR